MDDQTSTSPSPEAAASLPDSSLEQDKLVVSDSFRKQERKHLRRHRRSRGLPTLILGFILLAVVAAVVSPFWLGYVKGDIDPIDDSDLQLEKVKLASADNLYFGLVILEAFDLNYDTERVAAHMTGDEWEIDYVDSLLDKYGQALVVFEQMAAMKGYQDPAWTNPDTFSLDFQSANLMPLLKTARLSCLKAIRLSDQGEIDQALAQAIQPVQISYKIRNSQTDILSQVLALQLARYGLETMYDVLLTNSSISAGEAGKYLSQLQDLSSAGEGWKKTLIIDFYLIPEMAIDSISNDQTDLAASYEREEDFWPKLLKRAREYHFQPNKTKLLFADNAREVLGYLDMPYNQIADMESEALAPESFWVALYTENAVGKVLIDAYGVDVLKNIFDNKAEIDLLMNSLQTILAVRAYNAEQAEPVSDLAELVPDYLSDVPADPFSGQSIVYLPEQGLIYAVGSDGIDSDGNTGLTDEWSEMPDPAFRI